MIRLSRYRYVGDLLRRAGLVLLAVLVGCHDAGAPTSAPPRRYWPTEAWRSIAPARVGLDAQALRAAERHLLRYPTQAFLVVRHGYLAHEGYYGGFTADQRHDSYSVAKCVTSLTVGAAILQGHLSGVQARLADFISAEQAHSPNPAAYERITLEHLLSMTSGIDYNNRAHYPQMLACDSWARYVLARPIPHEPGSHWKYKADPTLLSAVVTAATGQSMLAYARTHLFEPIGMGAVRWDADPHGHTSGNGDLHATARDYARLGWLALNQGRWDGRQLLPSDWMARSTVPCRAPERTACDCWSETPLPIPPDPPLEYGYAWWCRRLPGVPPDAYYAFGGMGQFILVIPSLDLVAVRLADDRVHSDRVVLPEMARLIVRAVSCDRVKKAPRR